MTLTNDYHHSLKQLLPSGVYWDATDSQSELSIFLKGFADELALLDGFLQQSINEADPRTCNRTISSWVKFTQAQVREYHSLEFKRTAVLFELKAFFEKDVLSLAKGLGCKIELVWGGSTAPLLECGVSRCSDPFSTPSWDLNFVQIIVKSKPSGKDFDKDFFERKIQSIFLATRSIVFTYP